MKDIKEIKQEVGDTLVSKQPTIKLQEPSTPVKSDKVKTDKQIEKERKKKERYWNTMISRAEAAHMVRQAVRGEEEKIRILFIQTKTLTNFLIEKGLTTLEDLDKLSKPVIDEIYGTSKAPNSTFKETSTETKNEV